MQELNININNLTFGAMYYVMMLFVKVQKFNPGITGYSVCMSTLYKLVHC